MQGYKFGSKLPNSLSVAVPQAQLAVCGGIRMKTVTNLKISQDKVQLKMADAKWESHRKSRYETSMQQCLCDGEDYEEELYPFGTW